MRRDVLVPSVGAHSEAARDIIYGNSPLSRCDTGDIGNRGNRSSTISLLHNLGVLVSVPLFEAGSALATFR